MTWGIETKVKRSASLPQCDARSVTSLARVFWVDSGRCLGSAVGPHNHRSGF